MEFLEYERENEVVIVVAAAPRLAATSAIGRQCRPGRGVEGLPMRRRDATFNADRHVLMQPTVLRPQPADLLVLLDRDPGCLAAVNLGLGDCLDTASNAAVFGRDLVAASAIPCGCTVEPSSGPPREKYACQHARRQHLLTTAYCHAKKAPSQVGTEPSQKSRSLAARVETSQI